MRRYETLSVFPEFFEPYLSSSIMGRARSKGLFEFAAYNLRDWTHDRHNTVDDAPFGGGQGMLMKPEPIFEAVDDIQTRAEAPAHVVFFSPVGEPFTQRCAERLAGEERILFVCGRYEGMDERVYTLADEVISLGDEMSARDESFSDGLLEYEQYTRPAEYRGMKVPEVLLSGDHKAVDEWRLASALERTRRFRPDLYEAYLNGGGHGARSAL